MLLFYVRHGEPTYDPDCLTPHGRRQAEAIGRRLAVHGLDRIYSSTSVRAYQTAQPCAEMTGLQVEQLDWANEKYAWAQLTSPIEGTDRKTWGFCNPEVIRVFNLPEVCALGEDWFTHPYFQGTAYEEGINRIRKEADRFFLSLGYRHDRENGFYIEEHENNERVALFAHAGFGLAFLSSLLDIPYPLFSTRFDMSYTGLSVIRFKAIDGVVIPKMLTMSNDGHLYADGLPTRYNHELYI